VVVEKYLNAAIASWVKQSNPLTATTFYLGVSTSTINNDGTGASEPTAASGYQRYPIAINSTNWSAASNGVVSNLQTIKMEEILVDSGTATYWFLAESLTGNAVIFDKFKDPRILQKNSTIYINPSELKIGVQNISI